MAFAKGIVKIKEIELDDGIWEVEGKDATGHEIEMEVDAAAAPSSSSSATTSAATPSFSRYHLKRFAGGYRSINPFFCRHTGLY